MGDKIGNRITITGFRDEAARRAFQEAAEKGSVPFSFERLIPLAEPEEIELEDVRLHRQLFPDESAGRLDSPILSSIDLEAKWGSWIYEEEGDPESVNNKLELFETEGELGIEYSFDSRNDPPFNGIRRISRMYPDLLIKMYSENTVPAFFFSLYKNGERFFFVIDEEEFNLTRAGEWPMLAALSPENHRDESLHAFLREAAEGLPEDSDLEKEVEETREKERRRIEESVDFQRELLERRKTGGKNQEKDVPW